MSEILGEYLQRSAQSPEVPRIALAVQGGGLRGPYSLGGLGGMEEISEQIGVDFRDSFSFGIGSSAGSINLAHWAGGHAREGRIIYEDELTNGKFIPRLQPFDFQTARHDIGHAIRNRKMVDVDYLVDYALQKYGKLESFEGRIADSLYAAVTDAETGVQVVLRMLAEDPELYEVFRATGALPVLYNKVVEVHGGRYVDGG